MTQKPIDYSHRIITIPNMLTFLRIILIPVFVYFYLVQHNDMAAVIALCVSGLSDFLDGKIARAFNMISDFGKGLDPIADKLTQTVVLCCMISRYPYLKTPLIMLVIKEFITGIAALILIRREGQVRGADWHGKISTGLLDALMIMHLLPVAWPESFVQVVLFLTEAFMVLSFILYTIRNVKGLKTADVERKA